MTGPAANGISWLTRSLVELARANGKPRIARYNPRPAGVMHEGGASEAVLKFLRAQPPRVWLPKWRIVRGTGFGIKAVDHALRFLEGQGLINAAPDEQRNSRYKRYQAVAAQVEAVPA